MTREGYVWPVAEIEPPPAETLEGAVVAALEHWTEAEPGKDFRVVAVYQRGEDFRVSVEDA